MTLSLTYIRRWRIALLAVLCQAVGQCFGLGVYPVTSNAGELVLLIGTTYLLKLVQDELAIAGSLADFLRQSNVAFSHSSNLPKTGIDGANNSADSLEMGRLGIVITQVAEESAAKSEG